MFRHLSSIWSLFRTHPATRNRRMAAAARYVYWQIRRRLTARPMQARTVNGGRLTIFPGRTSTTAAYYLGLPDFDDMLFMLHLLRPGDRFVDGGANLGVWSVLAAGTGATVLAVEPAGDTHALLERQAAGCGCGARIRAVRCALADTPGSVWLSTGQDAANKVLATGEGVEIVADTLDRLTAGAAPTLIKLDLEGYEPAALRGAGRVLASPELLALVIETFRPHNWAEDHLRGIERLLGGHGFLAYEYCPAERRLSPLAPLDPGPGDGAQNTIYVRDRAAVEGRLRAAERIPVGGGSW